MANLPVNQYIIQDKDTFASIANLSTGKVTSVAKDTANAVANGDNIDIVITATLDVILSIRYQNLLSPDSDDIADAITILYPYFNTTPPPPICACVQDGTIPNATLRWDGSNWVESGTVKNDTYTLFWPGTVTGLAETSVSGVIPTTSGITVILVDTVAAAGNVTITLPFRPEVGRTYCIKDKTGNANMNWIIIDPGVGVTIDGSATITIKLKYHSAYLIFDGTNNWSII